MEKTWEKPPTPSPPLENGNVRATEAVAEARIERATPTPLASGDTLSVGPVEIEVQLGPVADGPARPPTTLRKAVLESMVMVVGDIVG
jgi:hypothetical protein